MRNLNGQQMSKKRKQSIDFSIEIKTNQYKVDFIDFILNQQNGTCRPYK